MNAELSTRQSKGRIMAKRIALSFAVVQFVVCTTAHGDLLNLTGAEQQVGGETGYKIGSTSYGDPPQFVPESPQGLSDADLSVSLHDYGVSISALLESSLLPGQITASGSSTAAAVWGSQPAGADDIHGGGLSTFSLTFTTGSSPVYFDVDGAIDVDMSGDLGRNPDEVRAYMRLSSGGTYLWEDRVSGTTANWSETIAHNLLLETGRTYLLEAYAEAGTGVNLGDSIDWQRNTASFSLTATATPDGVQPVPAPGAALLAALGLGYSGWRLRRLGT